MDKKDKSKKKVIKAKKVSVKKSTASKKKATSKEKSSNAKKDLIFNNADLDKLKKLLTKGVEDLNISLDAETHECKRVLDFRKELIKALSDMGAATNVIDENIILADFKNEMKNPEKFKLYKKGEIFVEDYIDLSKYVRYFKSVDVEETSNTIKKVYKKDPFTQRFLYAIVMQLDWSKSGRDSMVRDECLKAIKMN